MAKPKHNENSPSANLIAALRFVNLAQKKNGNAVQTHCNIANNCVIATDGIVTAGHKIAEDLTAKPKTLEFIEALENCNEVAIAQLEDSISVKSGKFQAFIPCLAESLPSSYPDYPCAEINNKLRDGFNAIEFLAQERSKELITGTMLLTSQSMFSTNKFLLIEYYHGINLPCNLVIPIGFVYAIAETSKNLSKFGFGVRVDEKGNQIINSITFWFDDDSWIKTQLFQEQWPDVTKILNVPTNYTNLYPSFYDAIDAVAPFTGKTESVYFKNDLLKSHKDDKQGATFEVIGLPDGMRFNYKFLKMIKPFVANIDFTSHESKLYFTNGVDVRGCLMGMRL
jgi:hypothetical protein